MRRHGTGREACAHVQETTRPFGSSFGSTTILPVDVCELLDSCIDSVEALDALLVLLSDASRWWSLPELAREIDVDLDTARTAVGSLRARALAGDAASSSLVRLAPLDPYSHAAFTSLARICATERAAVVEHLSRRSLARIRVLAQAFTRARGV